MTEIFKWIISAVAVSFLVWEWKWMWFPESGVKHSFSNSIYFSIFIVVVVLLVFIKSARWQKLWRYEKEAQEEIEKDLKYFMW
jgi:hypothetical protein